MPVAKCPGCGLVRGITIEGFCDDCGVKIEIWRERSIDEMLKRLYEEQVEAGHYDDSDQT